MTILNDKEYKCDWCGEIYNLVNNEEWSEDKAKIEYREYVPLHQLCSREIVCDDCWKTVRPRNAKSS
jgi:hypothetical protein